MVVVVHIFLKHNGLSGQVISSLNCVVNQYCAWSFVHVITMHAICEGLIFSNGQEFRLGPLFVAYEDWDQIIDLFVETFKQLSISANVSENRNATPATMWEKVDSLMTIAVTKGLGIEDTIPNAFGSNHHPYHLLCKSHTVEALNHSVWSNKKYLKASTLT